MRLFVGIIAFFVVGIAHAGPIDDARLAYIDGDYEEALAVLVPAAEAGDANAQNIVGDAYDSGSGVDVDHAKARAWWEKSAAQGFQKAQFNLGKLLSEGRQGIEPDYVIAEQMLQAAADQDNADAYNELALMHAFGRGRPVDLTKAAEFYELGHQKGSVISTSNLGAAYAKGEGVEQDYAKAFTFMQEAATKNDEQSLHNLGVLYRDGLHVTEDAMAAFLFFREARDQGYPKAGHQLADMMMVEGSAWHDPVSAYANCLWGDINASELQKEDLFLTCSELAEGLSEEEREDAQTWAEEY